jgi:dTMP kinase
VTNGAKQVAPDILEEPLAAVPHGLPGRLIAFSGVDGSGKTTLLEHTRRWLEQQWGVAATRVVMPSLAARREPLFQTLMYDPDSIARATIDPLAVALLVMADRRQMLFGDIMPRLARGEAVLCDRYVYCTLTDAAARGLDGRDALHRLAELFPRPDLSLVMDADAGLVLQRIRSRPAEYEMYVDEALLRRTVETVRTFAAANGFEVVPTNGEPEETFEQHVLPLLEQVVGLPAPPVRAALA